jgi:glycosyltransferase involved in cell wall biosynthesis
MTTTVSPANQASNQKTQTQGGASTQVGQPLVSVLIPCLNEEGVIGRLLGDLQASTLKDFEVVVCDNGSIDGTAEEVRRFAEADPRIHLVQLHEPGVSRARNTAARHARGQYLLFLDADSRLSPDFLQLALEQVQVRGLEVATFLVQVQSRRLVDGLLCRFANFMITLLSCFQPTAPGSAGYLVRRDIHEQSSGYDESMQFGEDVDYLRRVAAGRRFGIIGASRCIVDTRRLDLEGRWSVAKRMLLGTWYQRGGRRIEHLPFEYRFGHYRRKKERQHS